MDFGKLAGKAKKLVDDRGGVDALKEDAQELRDVAKGDESLADKAKDAAAALREPGAHGEGQTPPANEGEVTAP